ncbi:hypothetical protein QBC43DRAFT_310181 [Cladorrhinum sp. PSN259]|nr:hypothetical protein QBC43DRAFT_310181 [Cladorrhinum sp. PSN259]
MEKCPNEILAAIFEYLVPVPPLRIAPSLDCPGINPNKIKQRQDAAWSEYRCNEAGLLALSHVNKRMHLVVQPLLHRNILLRSCHGLFAFLAGLIRNPSKAAYVRHISSTVIPYSVWTQNAVMGAWMNSDILQGRVEIDPSVYPQDHPLQELSRWFGAEVRTVGVDLVSTALFAILCCTSKVETFHFAADHPGAAYSPNRSQILNWFMCDHRSLTERWPRPSRAPWPINAQRYPTMELLNRGAPHWPPPFLRKVIIEFPNGGPGRDVLVCNYEAPVEAVRHTEWLLALNDEADQAYNAFSFYTALVEEQTHTSISGLESLECVAMNRYLDYLARYGPIKGFDLESTVEALKRVNGPIKESKIPFRQLQDVQRLREILLRFPPNHWPIRNPSVKSLSIDLCIFMWTELDYAMEGYLQANISSLTIYVSNATGLVTTPSSLRRFRFPPTISYLHAGFMRNLSGFIRPGPFSFTRYAPRWPGSALRALHLPLFMDHDIVSRLYGAQTGWLNLSRDSVHAASASQTYVDIFSDLRTLSVTMEAIYGTWEFCSAFFASLNQWLDQEEAKATGEEFPLLKPLPAGITRLNLIEWYSAWTDPRGEFCTAPLWAVYRSMLERRKLILSTLERSLRVLKAQRPNLREIVFWWEENLGVLDERGHTESEGGIRLMTRAWKLGDYTRKTWEDEEDYLYT